MLQRDFEIRSRRKRASRVYDWVGSKWRVLGTVDNIVESIDRSKVPQRVIQGFRKLRDYGGARDVLLVTRSNSFAWVFSINHWSCFFVFWKPDFSPETLVRLTRYLTFTPCDRYLASRASSRHYHRWQYALKAIQLPPRLRKPDVKPPVSYTGCHNGSPLLEFPFSQRRLML